MSLGKKDMEERSGRNETGKKSRWRLVPGRWITGPWEPTGLKENRKRKWKWKRRIRVRINI